MLEGLYKSGKARAIGVSNFNAAHIQQLLAAAEVPPMVNQVRHVVCGCVFCPLLVSRRFAAAATAQQL